MSEGGHHRSVIFNDEVDAVVLASDTADELDAMFADDQRAAREINSETRSRRSPADRVKELYARIWQSWP